jgi:hypothetical protein
MIETYKERGEIQDGLLYTLSSKIGPPHEEDENDESSDDGNSPDQESSFDVRTLNLKELKKH